MQLRLAIALIAAAVLAFGPSPAHARAKDTVVARDTLIQEIWALDGDLVYWRYGNSLPQRVWMVRFKGRLHEAKGIPRLAGSGGLGLDANGRKVLTFRSAGEWFVYDLASDSARPVGDLGTSCPIDWLSIWRNSTAYSTSCQDPTKDELFVRRANQTRRVGGAYGTLSLTFREGTVAEVYEDGNDNDGVALKAAGGKSCFEIIPGSVGDGSAGDAFWIPRGRAQIVNGYIAWMMGDPLQNPDFRILAAKIRSGCETPGPVGVFPFKPRTAHMHALAVDDGRIFYADGKTLRRQVVPARPSTARPANDDFKRAKKLSGNLPLFAKGDTAYATAQRGEPLAAAGHTVWYAFRAKTTRRTYVTVNPWCRDDTPEFCVGSYSYGVYTGSRPDALTLIRPTYPPGRFKYTRIDAVAGHTYWIAIGSTFEPNYQPFTVRVAKKPGF
jgi:hypothetical protein